MNFPGYPRYSASSTDYLGALPEHWWAVPLKRLATVRNGRDYKEVEEAAGPYPVIGSGGEFARASKYLYSGESVLFGRKGTVDRPLLVSGAFWTVDTMFYTEVHRNTDSRFLFYAGSIIPFGRISTNTALPSVAQEDLSETQLPQPPLTEQTVIADFLDHETARIDALIEEQQRLINLLREKRDVLVYDATLDNDCYECRLATVTDTVERPVAIDDDALYEPIGLYNWGRGLFHKEVTQGRDLGDSDFFWLQDGDLIISGQFAWEGAVALASPEETNCVVTHRFPLLHGKSESLDTRFLFAWLTTRHGHFLLEENSRGSAGRNRPLNVQSLLKEKIIVPPLAKQAQVVELVEYERRIEEEARHQKDLLQEHRASLITNAVTGKIDLRERTQSIPSPERVLPEAAKKEGRYG